MIPINRKIMMSLEFSITKATMEITLSVARFGFFSSPPGVKISIQPGFECEADHRRLIRFDGGWKGEGVFLPLHSPPANWRGFLFGLPVGRKAFI